MIPQELADELLKIGLEMLKNPIHRQAEGASRGEMGALGFLAFSQNGVSAGTLREHFHVGSGRMADLLAGLERKDLIRREADPADGRRVLVFATEAGLRLAQTHMQRVQECQMALLEYLGEDDARELIRLMGRITDFHRQSPQHPLIWKEGAQTND